MLQLLQVSRITSFLSSSSAIVKKACDFRPSSLHLQTSSVSSSSVTNDENKKYTRVLFNLDLPEGHCVGVHLNDEDEDYCLENWSKTSHWVHECLHPAEVEYGLRKTRAVRKSFLLGRLAMRASLQHHQQMSGSSSSSLKYNHQPCLKDEHGRPIVPDGFSGSISHKGNVGVALSAPATPFTAIGIDIEQHTSNRRSIASKVLTEREIQELGRLKTVSENEEVMLRFSLKEAIYKASHPLLNQYVGFQEAEVTPLEDGTATVVWNLDSGAHTRLGSLTAHW
eukprot:CAMPEP_0119016564 /NCGR_PEP_ID=MMETSP1176-20130426/13594_1 /TAXON_ID=265551 /ORGANISM="Synedropsis recta cf, Strain CCMP1620" /LENGTH=280 /DNA_ID=CAMNT_0006970033 /DNA_START=119 /DNA_END=958 /DNA_ORIENTATION=-